MYRVMLNMARGAARVILNEVTSTNPTAMKGFLEVAGQKGICCGSESEWHQC